VPKADLDVSVKLGEESIPVSIDSETSFVGAEATQNKTTLSENCNSYVPLIKLAWARSGDKGNHSNIGVIARSEEYLPYIREALTEDFVAEYMSHTLDPEHGKVNRWDLPGINAVNFLLENSLGGGGVASLRIDPQGKAFAQQLLQAAIPVPQALANKL
jgi:hypothetical protein